MFEWKPYIFFMPRPDTITNKTTKLIAVNIINNDAQKVSI